MSSDEERQKNRGRLKIFLGYVAGVGKTYEMLNAAHLRKKEGVNVLIGYVETHGRAETEALLEGLTIVPRKIVEYREVRLEEMDLDAVIAARPDLVSSTNSHTPMHPVRVTSSATRMLKNFSMPG